MHATIAAERSQLNYTKSIKWKLKVKVIPKRITFTLVSIRCKIFLREATK